jgi:uncharacterized repeat protein (TIGR03803 family)
MKKMNTIKLIASTLAAIAAPAGQAGSPTILSFSGSDGQYPTASALLSFGSSEILGVTLEGGEYGFGTIFVVNQDGTDPQVFCNFSGTDGESPESPVIATDGSTFWAGTTRFGGSSSCGTVFALEHSPKGPDYWLVPVHSFSGPDGYYPESGVVYSGRTLYGTTVQGGTYGYGTVFSVSIYGTNFTTLHNFVGTDGSSPLGLTLSGSTLYGTADGVLFQINVNGTGFSVLNSNVPPIVPALTISGSELYGASKSGGTSGDGCVFSVSTTGTGLTTLHNFSGNDGSYPVTVLFLSGSSLYGTTAEGGSSGLGTVFSINTDGSGFTTLYNFTGTGIDGAEPSGGLFINTNTLFGTTGGGGSSGYGTVFALGL